MLALLGLLMSAGTMPAAAGASVSITARGRGLYSVEGEFLTTASRERAWGVLTDYNRLPAFISSMKSSVVKKREGNSILLEQKSVSRMLFFKKIIHVLLHVHEEPRRLITFVDESKKSFESYEGSWELQEAPGGLRVIYRLKVEEGSAAPGFMVKGVFHRMARSLLDQVQAEMEHLVV